MLFSEDPAHLERMIRKDQRSTSLDAAAFPSNDSQTQPSTDTRPSSSTDLHHSTLIDTTLRQKLDAQGNVIPDTDATVAAQPVEEAARPRALADYNRPDEKQVCSAEGEVAVDMEGEEDVNYIGGTGFQRCMPSSTKTCYSQKIMLTWNERSAKTSVPHRSTQQLSRRPILTPNRRPAPDLHRRPIYIDENGNLYDEDGHLRNATGQKLDAQGNVHAQQYQKQQGKTPAIFFLSFQVHAHLECTIRKDQCSISFDAAAFTSIDSSTQPSTDTRPSSSTDLHRSTSIDTTQRTSIDTTQRTSIDHQS
ncbi:hypothetical protein F2Q69_00030666 [Brassica cretica]|uniref:Uncharacterized protein n=1 Tax=Brassica cretica TaxID=69181 RepID=A0A8S9RUX9_BRACR|nr:hypothetical protein F2Q69_00030666 [Brassica cretica]